MQKFDSIIGLELERDKRVAVNCNREERVQGPGSTPMSSGCSTVSYTPRVTYDRLSLQPRNKRGGAYMIRTKKKEGEGKTGKALLP